MDAGLAGQPGIDVGCGSTGPTRKSSRCRPARVNLEIESTLVFPVSRGIAWTRVYPANPEIESMPACRADLETVWILADQGSQTSVDRDVLVITYKIFPAKLLTEASGRIGDRRISATFETIGKTIGATIGDWYGDSWWNNNHIHYPYYPGFGFWAGAAWSGLSGWGDYGWTEPVYYNYGDNVYYDDGSVYYGDQPVCTEQQYIEQAEAIAFSVPEAKPAAQDWMPLGVFAITQDGEPTGADPTMFLQLALSKQGVINGTFQNTATNTVKAVEGMVDKQTQRAAWTVQASRARLWKPGSRI